MIKHVRIRATAHVLPGASPAPDAAVVIVRAGKGFEKTFGVIGEAIVSCDGETNMACLRRHGLPPESAVMSLRILVRDEPEEK